MESTVYNFKLETIELKTDSALSSSTMAAIKYNSLRPIPSQFHKSYFHLWKTETN